MPGSDRATVIRRQAEGILAAGGGWNDRTRAGIAGLAQLHGVTVEWVVALLAAEEPPAADAGPDAQGAPARVAGTLRVPAVAPAGFRPSGPAVEPPGPSLAVGVMVLALALAGSVALGWFAFSRAAVPGERNARPPQGATRAVDAAGPGQERAEAPASDEDPSAPPEAAAPLPAPAARVAPVPAIYPRAPGFTSDGAPDWARTAAEGFAGNERELAEIRTRLSLGGRPQEADREAWARSAASFAQSWPLLDARRRRGALDAFAELLPKLGEAGTRTRLRGTLEVLRDAKAGGAAAIWTGAGAAGLLAALDRGAADAERAFGEAALAWLDPRGAALLEAIGSGDPATVADLLDAWIRATAEAGAPAPLHPARDARLLAVLDGMVRRGAPMDRPGTAADAAGSLLDALPWGGTADDRARIANAFAGWLMDRTIDARALHGVTSVLAARRPSPWWDPWLVCGARADLRAREATADRYRAALAAAGTAAAAVDPARIRGVRPEAVKRWIRVAGDVRGRGPGEALADRVARVAQLVAAAESLVLLERGRGAEAEARLAQLERDDGIVAREADRWKDGVEPKSVGKPLGRDGQLEESLRKAGGIDAQLKFLRNRRDGRAGDLGPVDAAFLARDALTARSAQLRAMEQDVIVEAFGAGPNMMAALAAELPGAAVPPEAFALVARLTGREVGGGSPAQRSAEAVLAVLDFHAGLLPAERHRVDAVARELVQAADAAAEACGGSAPGSRAMPEAAMRAWFDAALQLAADSLPAATKARLASQAEARRRLAMPGPQAAVAELVGLLEVEAALAAERQPRRRATYEALLRRASDARAAAPDAVAQLQVTAEALLDVALERLGAKGGAP